MEQSNCIADYMTPSSHSTHGESPLGVTGERMRRLHIRYLPVVQGAVLCGVLTERDVELARSLPRVEFERLSVAAAMNPDVYPVTRSAPVGHVVRTMLSHSYGCAVLMEGGSARGVFAAGDALRVLAAQLDSTAKRGIQGDELLAILGAEQAHLEALLMRAHRTVHRLRRTRTHEPERARRQASELSRHLLIAMRFHLKLEECVLAPVLAGLQGSPAARVQLLAQQVRHGDDVGVVVSVLDEDLSLAELADQIENIIASFQRELGHDATLLRNLDHASAAASA